MQYNRAQNSVSPKSANERYIAKWILTLSANPDFLTIISKISIQLMVTRYNS